MSSHLDDAADALDAVLVERHLSGDTTAFGELYARHYPRLLRYVRRRVHEQYVAEDIAQDSFIRALSSVADLRNRQRFYPWLTAIARHLVERHQRSASRLWVVTDPETGATEAADAELLRRESEADVRETLARIRPRYAEALRLREDEDLSYEQIAERLGLPFTAIPPLLFRARVAFRHEYLAVTRKYRRWFSLAPLFAMSALRRVRDRAAQSSWVPDANMLTASAFAVVGLGGLLLSPAADTATPSDRDSAVTLLAGGELGRQTAALASEAAPAPSRSGRGLGHGAPAPQPDAVIGGLAEVNVNNQRRIDHNRERARQMPIYYEIGPAGFAADPGQMRRDIESTLDGNPDWLEGS